MGSPTKRDVLLLVGRLLLAGIFLYAGYNKLVNVEGTVQFMGPMGAVWKVYAAAAAEIIGGLLLVLGGCVHTGAMILSIYLVVATYLMHFPGAPAADTLQILKNASVLGGLLVTMACGGGTLQFYRCKCDKMMCSCCDDSCKCC